MNTVPHTDATHKLNIALGGKFCLTYGGSLNGKSLANHFSIDLRNIYIWSVPTPQRTKSKRLQNQPEWRLLPQDTPAFSLVCFKVGLYYNRLLKHYRGWTQASLAGQGVALGTPEQVKSKASSCQAEEHRGDTLVKSVTDALTNRGWGHESNSTRSAVRASMILPKQKHKEESKSEK